MPREGVALGQDHFVHRRHAGQVGHPVALDGANDFERIEAAQQDDAAAGEEERFDDAGHRILVIQRDGHQTALRVIDHRRLAEDVGVPDLAAVGQEHAFRTPGRARRVRLHADVGRIRPAARQNRRSRADERRIIVRRLPIARVHDHLLHGSERGSKTAGALGQHRAGDEHACFGIFDHIAERLVAHPDVQRDGHGAQAHDAEQHFEKRVLVAEHERHAVAGANAERRQRVGHSVAASVEIFVGDGEVVLKDGHAPGSDFQWNVEEVAEVVRQHDGCPGGRRFCRTRAVLRAGARFPPLAPATRHGR